MSIQSELDEIRKEIKDLKQQVALLEGSVKSISQKLYREEMQKLSDKAKRIVR